MGDLTHFAVLYTRPHIEYHAWPAPGEPQLFEPQSVSIASGVDKKPHHLLDNHFRYELVGLVWSVSVSIILVCSDISFLSTMREPASSAVVPRHRTSLVADHSIVIFLQLPEPLLVYQMAKHIVSACWPVSPESRRFFFIFPRDRSPTLVTLIRYGYRMSPFCWPLNVPSVSSAWWIR